jgi:DegV family protein with EDD domain
LTEIVEALELLRDRIVLGACIDTLEYLFRGGRISQTAYKLGTLANIKPIITVEADGSIAVPAKAMGMRKGMDILCKKLESRKPDPDFGVYVMYTNNPEVARNLAAKLEEQGIYVPESHWIQVGAAIGAHIGPEACGLVYVS